MELIIGIYIVCVVVAVVIPTLPSSRRLRLALSVLSVGVILFGYQYAERFASRVGADYMDAYIAHSAQLLKDGRADVLAAAYSDYQQQHGPSVPAAASAAYRASLLRELVREHEYDLKK